MDLFWSGSNQDQFRKLSTQSQILEIYNDNPLNMYFSVIKMINLQCIDKCHQKYLRNKN